MLLEPKDQVVFWFQLLVLINKHRGITFKSRYMVKYPDLPSTIRPVSHSQELPVAEPLEYQTFSDDNSDSDENHRQQEQGNVDCDLTFVPRCSSPEPHLLTQGDLNNLVCYLDLS
jgi:hypothetical protein